MKAMYDARLEDLGPGDLKGRAGRHRWDRQTPRTMHLDETQNLVGRIVEAWLHEVTRRRGAQP
jgi:hypothetical protein